MRGQTKLSPASVQAEIGRQVGRKVSLLASPKGCGNRTCEPQEAIAAQTQVLALLIQLKNEATIRLLYSLF